MDNEELWYKIKDLLVWIMIIGGTIGALFGATELLPYTVLGIALKLMMIESNLKLMMKIVLEENNYD